MSRELDAKVAAKVMGWRNVTELRRPVSIPLSLASFSEKLTEPNYPVEIDYMGTNPHTGQRKAIPPYSTDDAYALDILKHLNLSLIRHSWGWMAGQWDNNYLDLDDGVIDGELRHSADSVSMPMAICYSALEVVGSD